MPPGEDKRKSARIKFRLADHLEVRYKFLSRLRELHDPEIYTGTVLNLSKGGALFEGPVPGIDWLPKLGAGEVMIGMNVMAPGQPKPVKALATLRWTRPAAANGRYELGVQFEQVEPEHRASLDRFLISHQIRTRKLRREPFG
jgi:c-di-GMP-binding flagellar brake protein YcgR